MKPQEDSLFCRLPPNPRAFIKTFNRVCTHFILSQNRVKIRCRAKFSYLNSLPILKEARLDRHQLLQLLKKQLTELYVINNMQYEINHLSDVQCAGYTPGLLSLGTVDILDWILLCCRVLCQVLGTEGGLTASLASAHQTPIAPLHTCQLGQICLQILQKCPWGPESPTGIYCSG